MQLRPSSHRPPPSSMPTPSQSLHARSNWGEQVTRNRSFSSQADSPAQMSESSQMNQRGPDRVGQAALNEKLPEPVRSVVEQRHSEITRNGRNLPRPARPDGFEREQPLINPS